MAALRPYLEEFWRESIEDRGIDSLDSISYPPRAPISARSDLRDASGRAATTLAALQAQVFGRWGAAHAICNCLYGVQLVFNEDMAKAFARAVNDWIAKECWIATRACGRRSWCRSRTSNPRSMRSSVARKIPASCRSWCWLWARRRSGAVISGRSTRRPSAMALSLAFAPAAPTAIR
jgi:hypothetical protein